MFTRADDACVKYGEILLAGGEGGDGEGAVGLGAAAHPPFRRRTGTLYSWTHKEETSYYFFGLLSTHNCQGLQLLGMGRAAILLGKQTNRQ